MHSSKDPPDTARCPNCGTSRRGPWCHACGQRAPEPLRFSRITRDVLEQITDLGAERGLFHTLRQLTIRPGQAIRAYVDGRRKPLVNPVKYAFFALTIVAVTVGVTGTDPGEALGIVDRSPVERQALAISNALLAYLAFLSMLPVAALQRWLFKGRMAIAENYAFQLFVTGHLALFDTLAIVIGLMESFPGMVIVICAHLLYVLFALGGFHQRRGMGLLWRGIAVQAGGFIALNGLAWVFANLLNWLGVLDALERLLI
jgi:hypothetical protein